MGLVRPKLEAKGPAEKPFLDGFPTDLMADGCWYTKVHTVAEEPEGIEGRVNGA